MSTRRIKKERNLWREKKKKDRRGNPEQIHGSDGNGVFFWGGEHIKPNVKIQRKVKRPIDDLKYGRCSIIKITVISACFTSA